MPESSSLRLYVYIRVNTLPATVEIEFPSEEVAHRYRLHIMSMETKVLAAFPQRPKTVVIELPRSVTDLETNRSLQAFVLHFDQAVDADAWADAVCRRVKDHPRQIFIKQYWNGVDELEQQLVPVVPEPSRPEPSRPDRAGTPPTQESPSGKARRRRRIGVATQGQS